MVKWVYDSKKLAMTPENKDLVGTEILIRNTPHGLKVQDIKYKKAFIISSDDDITIIDGPKNQSICADYKRAVTIAKEIRKVYPNSKFANPDTLLKYRAEELHEMFSADDKAVLRCILEEVSTADIDKYVDSINEVGDYLLGNKWSVGKTPGADPTKHGVKDLIKALPSAGLSFLICPPATIIRLIGAVRQRAEKRYVKSIFNPNRYLDFIATEKQKTQAEDDLKKKSQYYYSRLYNGEIIRVVGSSILEAKEMIMAIEHKDIIPRYANWNNALKLHVSGGNSAEDPSVINTSNTDNFIMWVIKFKDGEACYAFGRADANDKENIKEAAIESRKSVVEYYKSIKYRDEDNNKKKSQRHDQWDEDTMKLFKVPDIEDMIRIDNPNAYKMITETNYKMFTEPTTSPLYWEEQGQVSYRINVKFGEFTVPLANDKEYRALVDILSKDQGGFNLPTKTMIARCFSMDTPRVWKKVKYSSTDWFFILTNEDPQNAENKGYSFRSSISEDAKKNIIAYETAIELAINQGVKNKTISEKTREQYNKIKQINASYSNSMYYDTNNFTPPTDNNATRDVIEKWYSDWPNVTTAVKIDRHTNANIEQNIRYKETA